ncbi:hypothetical protein MPSEU_000411300 [Mayamaea pseudoterrestris]|nr:hypothetical protein MPSEU_000411300 [Mayamaea pseudoterrestris]
MSADEVKTRHNKELKALEGEKRAELKKAKGTAGKGQKGKEILAALEAKYDERFVELKTKHADELAAMNAGSSVLEEAAASKEAVDDQASMSVANDQDQERQSSSSKAEKARRKREKAREKELERERNIQDELDNAGPTQRQVEMETLMEQLAPLDLVIQDVAADGHCLYRAIGAACGKDFMEIRQLCADALDKNQNEFAPFCDYTDEITTFEQYTNRIRNSADWGGHLELRALSIALGRPMIIYQAHSVEPLCIECEQKGEIDPIRLSYHRHYYALGEHYNLVVAKN